MNGRHGAVLDASKDFRGMPEELREAVQSFAEQPGMHLSKVAQIEDLVERLQAEDNVFDPLAFLMGVTDVAESLPIGFPNNEVDEVLINHSANIHQMLLFFQSNELRNKSSRTFGFIWSRILDLNPQRLPDLVACIPEGTTRILSVPNVKEINLRLTPENAAMWHEIIVEIFENTKRADAIRYTPIRSCLMNCPQFSDAWDALKLRIERLMSPASGRATDQAWTCLRASSASAVLR
jgi:hypothetical protein